MTFYRGQDGSAKWGGSVIANVNQWTLRGTAGVMEGTAMGDKSRKRLPGLVTFSGQLTMRLNAGDAQQLAMISSVFSATPATASTALLLVNNSTGPKQFSGNAILTNINVTQPLEGVVEMTADWESDGDWTISWT